MHTSIVCRYLYLQLIQYYFYTSPTIQEVFGTTVKSRMTGFCFLSGFVVELGKTEVGCCVRSKPIIAKRELVSEIGETWIRAYFLWGEQEASNVTNIYLENFSWTGVICHRLKIIVIVVFPKRPHEFRETIDWLINAIATPHDKFQNNPNCKFSLSRRLSSFLNVCHKD